MTSSDNRRSLASNLGHEITGSLNALLGACALASQEAGVSSEGHRNLDIIRGATREIQLTAFNLLAYYAGEERAPAGQRCRIVIPDMLGDIVDAARPLIDARRVDLRVQIKVGSPFTVIADKHHLRILVADVLAHSMRVTANGHIDLTVHASDVTGGASDALWITVADTGRQVSSKAARALFQAYGGRNQLYPGAAPQTGLNLPVARKLAEAMDGYVTYRASSDGRNTYEIKIPAEVSSLVASVNASEHTVVGMDALFSQHRRRVEPQRVLVIEDQRSNAHLIESILRRAGHAVTIAGSGEAGLRYLRDGEFDVAYVDLRLPGMGGIGVMRQTGHSRHDTTAFVVLTSEDDERVRDACAAAGAQVFLSKPISAQRLLESLQAVVAHRGGFAAKTRDDEKLTRSARPPHSVAGAASGADLALRLEQAQQALAAGDAQAAQGNLRAVRGLAFLLGETKLLETCTAALTVSNESLLADRHAWAARLARAHRLIGVPMQQSDALPE